MDWIKWLKNSCSGHFGGHWWDLGFECGWETGAIDFSRH